MATLGFTAETPRRREIGEEAQAIMLRGFAAGWTAERVARAVSEEAGETVSTRTIARRAAEWRAEMARRTSARERMEDLVAAMRSGNMDASEMIQALAMDRLVDDPDALAAENPVRVQKLSLQAEELRLKRRKLDVQERQVAVTEKKLALLESRDARVKAVAEKPEMTAEERLAEIQAIYGIRQKAS
jgi:hypothetical protein